MSLRESLRATVARCAPIEVQRATTSPNRATGHATTAQQLPVNPHGYWVSDATAHATGTQQGVKTHATLGPEMGGESCTELHGPGALTAHRITAELLRVAMRRCDQFGDHEAKRAQMRGDCLELSPRLQADLLQHFTKDANGTSI
jgi:hypothetical protein